MITQKFRANIPPEIIPYITQFSCATRVGYNRLKEGMSLSEAESYIKTNHNNIPLIDASLIKLAVNKSKSLVTKEKTVVFGGYKNLDNRAKNKITKEQWAELRNSSILLRGSTHDLHGNRKAKLDIENEQIIFRPKLEIQK
jgi:hypothetical protein